MIFVCNNTDSTPICVAVKRHRIDLIISEKITHIRRIVDPVDYQFNRIVDTNH